MGGTIALTLRLPDGAEYRMLRWTNILPWLVANLRLLDAEPVHLDAIMEHWHEMHVDYTANAATGNFQSPMTPVYFPCGNLAPVGYGLVVVDLKARTILSMQEYTDLKTVSPFGESAFLEEVEEKGASAALARLRAQMQESVPMHERTVERMVRLYDAGLIRGLAVDTPDGVRVIPFKSLEDALTGWAGQCGQNSRGRAIELTLGWVVDYAARGWTLKEFEETPRGIRAMQEAVEALGFALTDQERTLWREYAQERSRKT